MAFQLLQKAYSGDIWAASSCMNSSSAGRELPENVSTRPVDQKKNVYNLIAKLCLMPLSESFLWLFILNLGIAFGAGIYETRIVLPQWFTQTDKGWQVNTKAIAETDTGRKFWGFVTTMPLSLLTLANLYCAWHATMPRHDWWIAASCITLVERLGTFGFFIPTIIKLSTPEKLPPARVSSLVATWRGANYVRCLLNLLGWLAAMKVLSLPI